MKLNILIEEWLYCYHKGNIKPQTFMRYECAWKVYIEPNDISKKNIKKISPREIQEYVNIIKKQKGIRTKRNLSPTSINTVITVLGSAFTYAVDFGLLKDNPCEKIKRVPKKVQKKVNAFTVQEQKKIERYLLELNNPEYFGIILCLYTGLRIGELVALEWDDIDFGEGTMSINKTFYPIKGDDGLWHYEISIPKTRKSLRDIPLPDYILDELIKLKKISLSKNVISRLDGSLLTSNTHRERFANLTKTLGISSLNFHALRHTFATRALESGMDVKTLADIMGHANASITLNIYAHSMSEHKKNMMNNIPKLITC